MHAPLMDDWIVYVIVLGTVALLLAGKFLMLSDIKKKK